MPDKITDEQITEAAQKLFDRVWSKAKHEWTDGGDVEIEPTDEELHTELDWILTGFKDFLTPAPRDFDDILDKIKAVEAVFGQDEEVFGSTDLEAIDTAKGEMAEWEGALATNFTENFLQPLVPIVANHGRLASNLHRQLELTQQVFHVQRENALKLAEDAYKAVDAINRCSGSDLKILLAAIIAATNLTTLLLGKAGMGAQLFSATILSGAVMGGPFVEEGEHLELGSDTVLSFLPKLRDAMQKIHDRRTEEEDRIIDALKDTEATVYPLVLPEEREAGTALVPMNPHLNGAETDELLSGLVQFQP